MDIPAKDIKGGEFFATADQPPGNVWIMRVAPRRVVPTGGYEPGLCQNIDDESFWSIEPHKLVRRIAEHEHDKRTFYV